MKGERRAINGAEAEGAALQKEAALSAGSRGGIVVGAEEVSGVWCLVSGVCTELLRRWRLIGNSTPSVPALLIILLGDFDTFKATRPLVERSPPSAQVELGDYFWHLGPLYSA